MKTSLSVSTVIVALVFSASGHVFHNLAEFPAGILLGWETLFPLLVTVVIGAALLLRPGRTSSTVAAGWAVVVLVGGGGSVLPLPYLPFVPEQSVSHYLAHLVYGLLQLPLLWVGYRGVASDAQADDHQVPG